MKLRKKMPYNLRKSRGHNAYWVVNEETGKKFSRDPIPRERAEAQRRALYAVDNGYILNRSKSRSRSNSKRSKASRKSRSRSKSRRVSEPQSVYRKTPRYLKRYTEYLKNDE